MKLSQQLSVFAVSLAALFTLAGVSHATSGKLAIVPSGTGFVSVTSGVEGTTARAVNLASPADVINALPVANQISEISLGSTSGATGASVNIAPQASTNANGTSGDVNVYLTPPTGAGSEDYFTIWRGGAKIIQLGATTGATSFTSMYINGVTPGTTTYAFLCSASACYFNTPNPSGGGVLHFQVGGGTDKAFFTPSAFSIGVPIIGDNSASPYGVHGDAAIALSSTRSATASEYSAALLTVTPTAGGLTLSLPLPSAGAAYPKTVTNPSTFTFSLYDGAGTSVVVPASSSKTIYWFTGGGVK